MNPIVPLNNILSNASLPVYTHLSINNSIFQKESAFTSQLNQTVINLHVGRKKFSALSKEENSSYFFESPLKTIKKIAAFVWNKMPNIASIFYTESSSNNKPRNKREISANFDNKASFFEKTINDTDVLDEYNIDFLNKIPEDLQPEFFMYLEEQLVRNLKILKKLSKKALQKSSKWKDLAKNFKFVTDFYHKNQGSFNSETFETSLLDAFQLLGKISVKDEFQFSVFASFLDMDINYFIKSYENADIYLTLLNDSLQATSNNTELHKLVLSYSGQLFKMGFLSKCSAEEFQKIKDKLANVVDASLNVFNSYGYEHDNQGYHYIRTFIEDALDFHIKLTHTNPFKQDCIKILNKKMSSFFQKTKLSAKEKIIIKHLMYFAVKNQPNFEENLNSLSGFWEKVTFQDIYPYSPSFKSNDKNFKKISFFSAIKLKKSQKVQIRNDYNNALKKTAFKNSDTFNVCIAKDLVSYLVYNPAFFEQASENFHAYRPDILDNPDIYEGFPDTLTLPAPLRSISKEPLSIAVYVKDSEILDLERKYEKAFAYIPPKTKPTTTTQITTLEDTTSMSTEEQTSTTEVEGTSTVFITQSTTFEDTTSISAEEQTSITEVAGTSTMFTTQSTTSEDTTSTEEPTSTIEVTSTSPVFTTQSSTPEDVTIIPTGQDHIIKPVAIMTGIFSAVLAFIGVYIFRRRKSRSYTIPTENVSNVEPIDYQDVMETNV